MSTHGMWCRVCEKMVAVVIEEGAASLVAPIVGGTAGGAIGGAKAGAPGGILGALLGAAVGVVVQSLVVPKAQRLVCGQCGHAVA